MNKGLTKNRMVYAGAALAFLLSSVAAELPTLENDPAIRFGELENGLRYAILQNDLPEDRASFRLHIAAGSVNESEDQRGVAHFLEHMSFNGGENYAPGTLVEFFQRLGMSFGGDTNAFTNFDQTVYQLDLPNTDPDLLEDSMAYFEDTMDGLLLLPEEIDAERGIILSEKRARDSVGFRIFQEQMKFLLDGTLIPERMPIGLTSVISEAPPSEFRKFYDDYYRPDLMTLVAVGDFDPDVIEQAIKDRFADIEPRTPAAAPLDMGTLKEREGTVPFYYHESESPSTSVGIVTERPYAFIPDSAAKRLNELPREIAYAILNRRFSVLAKEEGAVFSAASSGTGDAYKVAQESYLELNCQPNLWRESLALGEQELRRALTFGFLEEELAEAIANYKSALEQAAAQAETRQSKQLADALTNAIHEGEFFASPEALKDLLVPVLDSLTVEDCEEAFRKAWSAGHRLVFATGNVQIDDAEAAIVRTFEESQRQPVEAPAELKAVKWAYSDFGEPGKVASKEYVEDLNTTLVEFENGLKLNIKPTDFESDTVRINVRIGGGKMTQPAESPGLSQFSQSIFQIGGTGKHTADEIERVLAGKTVQANFSVANDAFVFAGMTSAKDLELGLQLIGAYITDPGFRPEVLSIARKGFEQIYNQLEHAISGPIALEVERKLANGDSRFGLPVREIMAERTVTEVAEWLAPQLADGSIELAIVGDVDVSKTIEAVGATLGALGQRANRPSFEDLREVAFPPKPLDEQYSVDTEIEQGLVYLAWPARDGMDVHLARRISLLTAIFSDRLRVTVREEIGGAYSPYAQTSLSDTYHGYGYVLTSIVVDPPMAEKIAEVVEEITQDMAKNGVSEDELDRARQPSLASIRQSLSNNGYWLQLVLAKAQEKPEVLDWSRDRLEDYQSITVEELNELAALYFVSSRMNRVIIKPE